MITQLYGDNLELLPTLMPGSVQCVVTSPPYWQQRTYTDDPREVGRETTIAEYVAALARVFEAARPALRDDGTLWLNLGDAYANDTKWGGASGAKNYTSAGGGYGGQRVKRTTGLPPKSLIGLPWRVAIVLQDAGWVLRSEIIWEKPNVKPESVKDRPTLAHETIFLFVKQGDYYYDDDAIAEPAAISERRITGRDGREQMPGRLGKGHPANGHLGSSGTRNARSVWRINTRGIPDEHYAPFPDELPRRCILAGSRAGDTILDPFAGSGTTMRVAESLGRHSIGIDLGYQELQQRRTDGVQIDMRAFL